MKVGFVVYVLSSQHSGITISLLEYCRQLIQMGQEVCIFCLYCDSTVKEEFEQLGAMIYPSVGKVPFLLEPRMFMYSHSLATKLRRNIDKVGGVDAYVVYADEAIPVVELRNSKPWLYVFQGDLTLLLLKRRFREKHRIGSMIVSPFFVRYIAKHSKLLNQFDAVAANSEFSTNLASFLYDITVDRVIYPPLQTEVLSHDTIRLEDREACAIAVLRNDSEGTFDFVSKLASGVKLKIIGGARIENCESLGYLDFASYLTSIAKALVLIVPSNDEYFGRATIEALGVGTPVLGFNSSGAKEIISGHDCGWLASDSEQFLEILTRIMSEKYASNIIPKCRERARRFESSRTSSELLDWISTVSSKNSN